MTILLGWISNRKRSLKKGKVVTVDHLSKVYLLQRLLIPVSQKPLEERDLRLLLKASTGSANTPTAIAPRKRPNNTEAFFLSWFCTVNFWIEINGCVADI